MIRRTLGKVQSPIRSGQVDTQCDLDVDNDLRETRSSRATAIQRNEGFTSLHSSSLFSGKAHRCKGLPVPVSSESSRTLVSTFH